MKRRNSKTQALDPPPIREFLSFKSRSNPEFSRETKDDDDDNPKTSEYAYFKKLKTHARHNGNADGLKTGKSSGASSYFKDSRPLESAKSVAPSNFDAFTLPSHGRALKYSEKKSKGGSTILGGICNIEKSTGESIGTTRAEGTFFAEKKSKEGYTTFGDMYSIGESVGTLRTGGTQDMHGDVFSIKRRRLRQWIAETSFPEIDEFDTDKNNLVSMLLSRLFPRGNEYTGFWTPRSWKMESNTKHLPAFLDPDVHFKKSHQMKSHQMSTRNLTGAESSWDLDYGLPWSDRTRSRVLSNFDSTTCRDIRTLEYNVEERTPELGGRTTISCIRRDCGFGLSFSKKAYSLPDFCKDLDDYHDPTTPTWWGSGHLLTLDSNDYEADSTYGLSASSVIPGCTPSFISFSPSHLASYQRHDSDITRRVFEDMEAMATNWNHLHVHGIHKAVDMSNFHDFSSSYIHLSLDKEKPCPLMLEKSSQDRPEDDIYDDNNNDDEAGYLHWMLPWKS